MWDDKRRVAQDEPRLLGNQDTLYGIVIFYSASGYYRQPFFFACFRLRSDRGPGQDNWIESPPVMYGEMQ